MEKFDDLMRDLSLKVARTTTRRGFLTQAIQVSAGMGLLTGVLFGSGRKAFAASCQMIDRQFYNDCISSHADNCNYDPETGRSFFNCVCASPDGDRVECQNCPPDYSTTFYFCCCAGRKKRCTTCRKSIPNGSPQVCVFTQLGAACP